MRDHFQPDARTVHVTDLTHETPSEAADVGLSTSRMVVQRATNEQRDAVRIAVPAATTFVAAIFGILGVVADAIGLIGFTGQHSFIVIPIVAFAIALGAVAFFVRLKAIKPKSQYRLTDIDDQGLRLVIAHATQGEDDFRSIISAVSTGSEQSR